MQRYDYQGCSHDGPIAATDTYGCGKYGMETRGGSMCMYELNSYRIVVYELNSYIQLLSFPLTLYG